LDSIKFGAHLNLFWINLNSFGPGIVPPGPACQPVPPPGTVLPRPACQPVPPLRTMAVAHRSAPGFPVRATTAPPVPVDRGLLPAVHRWVQAPLYFPLLPPCGRRPWTPPPPLLPAAPFKSGAAQCHRAPFFSPPFSLRSAPRAPPPSRSLVHTSGHASTAPRRFPARHHHRFPPSTVSSPPHVSPPRSGARSLTPSPLQLRELRTDVVDHRSPPERMVEPCSAPSCLTHPLAPWELMPPPLLLLGHRLGHDNHATTSPQSAHGRDDHAGRARTAPRLAGHPNRFSQWADPVGQSLCSCPATVQGRPPHPVGCSLGLDQAQHCAQC
jgi:hypothetical protein